MTVRLRDCSAAWSKLPACDPQTLRLDLPLDGGIFVSCQATCPIRLMLVSPDTQARWIATPLTDFSPVLYAEDMKLPYAVLLEICNEMADSSKQPPLLREVAAIADPGRDTYSWDDICAAVHAAAPLVDRQIGPVLEATGRVLGRHSIYLEFSRHAHLIELHTLDVFRD